MDVYYDILNKFNSKNLKLYEIDSWYNDYIDYGEIVYKEEFSKFYDMLAILKVIGIIGLINSVFWLVINLLAKTNNLAIFGIFGIGISIITLLIVIVSYLIINRNKKCEIIIYENGISQTGVNIFYVAYDNIIEITNENRILIKTNYAKFKLVNTKNKDKIYDMIKDKVKEV